MFSLFHFSPVFPYIHPYLFPVESAKPKAVASDPSPQEAALAATTLPAPSAEDAAALARLGGKRLKSRHRRQARGHRGDALTYSGLPRHASW